MEQNEIEKILSENSKHVFNENDERFKAVPKGKFKIVAEQIMQLLPIEKSEGEVLYRNAREKLESISDSRYSIPMPFNWDMLYKAMEEYKSQSANQELPITEQPGTLN